MGFVLLLGGARSGKSARPVRSLVGGFGGSAWELDIRHTPPAFGESVSDLERRVGNYWRASSPLPAAGEIANVGHGGYLAALHALIAHEPTATIIASRLELGAMVGVDAG